MMKNILEIQARLAKIRDKKVINEGFNDVPEQGKLTKEEKEILYKEIILFLDKLIKHLNSKNPTRSSISNLFSRTFYKLQHAGIKDNSLKCFADMVTKIINNTFEGAFSNRPNVKSQEFINLEDWRPS